MREIENNLNNVNFKGIPAKPIAEETAPKVEVSPAPAEQKEIKVEQLAAKTSEQNACCRTWKIASCIGFN